MKFGQSPECRYEPLDMGVGTCSPLTLLGSP